MTSPAPMRALSAALHPECGWTGQLRRIRRKLAWAAVILPHLFRNPLVRNVIAREAGGEPPGVTSPHFQPAFTLLTGSPLTAGNAVEVLANGDAAFPRLWSDLRSARRPVTVQVHCAGPGAVADSATRILAERARAVVDVRVLINSAQSDVKTTWLAGRSRYETLLAAGGAPAPSARRWPGRESERQAPTCGWKSSRSAPALKKSPGPSWKKPTQGLQETGSSF